MNLTNFPATPSQAAAGVENVGDRSALSALLNFTELPTPDAISERASALADIAKEAGVDKAMISGAPYLMGPLEDALRERGITPTYAFSERVSTEVRNEDGTVTKKTEFEHKGFVDAPNPNGSDDGKDVERTSGTEDGILNLTQHEGTEAQKEDGVKEPSDKDGLRELLTFKGQPTKEEVAARAEKIADKAVEAGFSKAMIGGAPYLMGPLEKALEARGVMPTYAYSERRVEERTNPDTGKVEKITTFEHKGFVDVPTRTERDDEDKASKDEDESATTNDERSERNSTDSEPSTESKTDDERDGDGNSDVSEDEDSTIEIEDDDEWILEETDESETIEFEENEDDDWIDEDAVESGEDVVDGEESDVESETPRDMETDDRPTEAAQDADPETQDDGDEATTDEEDEAVDADSDEDVDESSDEEKVEEESWSSWDRVE